MLSADLCAIGAADMLRLRSSMMFACVSGVRWLALAVLASFGLTMLIPAQSFAGPGDVVNEDIKKVDYFAAAARVNLRVKGSADLSGDYRVGPDQTISLPVIGRVQLTGKDGAALESELSQRIAAITKKEAFVTVEIAAYRPIFVTGAVHNPGAVEWQPQMTVLQAVILAGGPERLTVNGAAGDLAFPLTREKSVDGQKRDLAKLARLQAARVDAAEIEPSNKLIELIGPNEAAQLIAAESDALLAERNTFLEKRRIIAQSIVAEKEQIASLRVQLESIKWQLETRRLHYDNLKILKEKGYLTNERLLEQEARVLDLLEKAANVEVGIAKGIGTLATLELSQVSLVRDRQLFLMEEIGKIERVSAHVGMDLNATRILPSPTMNKEKGSTEYQIVGKNGQVVLGSFASSLLPGDVLIVARR